MRRSLLPVLMALVAGFVAQIQQPAEAAVPASASRFVQAVLRDGAVAVLQGTRDLTGLGAAGTVVGQPMSTTLPNGDPALRFSGNGQYLQFADRKAFEVDSTGVLTVEFWMRPDTLQFTREEGSGYVYVLGKGDPGRQEWFARMYSKSNSESRPNRISAYAFNPAGGLGAGSYFQEPVRTGEWVHVALVVNSKARSAQYPTGYTRIYKNGVLKDTDSLKDYSIVPRSGSAPLRIGTGYLNSFFQGAVGDVAFYGKELSAAQLAAHHAAMYAAPVVTPAPSIQHSVSGTNVRRGTNQLVRYTPSFGRTTATNAYGFEAAVVNGKVTVVRNGVGNLTIPAGGYVLSGHGDARQWLQTYAKLGVVVRLVGSAVVLSAPA